MNIDWRRNHVRGKDAGIRVRRFECRVVGHIARVHRCLIAVADSRRDNDC